MAMFELLLLVYLASLVAAPLMADKQGRNGFGWFALAVLFGPLAVLALAIVGQGAPRPVNPLSDPTMRQCPHCLSPIPAQASVCAVCHRDVPVVDPLLAIRRRAVSLHANMCPECSGKVGPGALGCSHCKADLSLYRRSLEAPPPRSRPQA